MQRLTDALGAALALSLVAFAAFAGVSVNVPEPASMGLIAAGIAGVAWVKFRRRK